MSGRKRVGRPWVVTGSVWRHGKRVRHVKKTVTISSEEELEKHEHELRDKLYEQCVKTYGDIKGEVRIEVSSEVE